MFTTSFRKMSNTFSIIGFIAKATLKLISHTWCKDLGNKVFEANIITEFILAFKNNLQFRAVERAIHIFV